MLVAKSALGSPCFVADGDIDEVVILMRLFVLVAKSALGSPCFVADGDIDEVVCACDV